MFRKLRYFDYGGGREVEGFLVSGCGGEERWVDLVAGLVVGREGDCLWMVVVVMGGFLDDASC